MDPKFNDARCDPIFDPSNLEVTLDLEHKCGGDSESIVEKLDTTLSVFKKTLSLGVHLIENTQEFFTFTTSNPACGIESIKIYTDEEGLNEFDIGTSSAIDGNYKVGISLTSPFKMQTLFIVAKTHSGKTAFKKMELNICPNTMDTDREASYFPIRETG